MINEETRRKLRLMNIGEFIEASEEQEQDVNTLALSFDDRFQMMVDSVYQQKYNDKVHNLIKRAHLRLPKADIHNVFYHEKRTLIIPHPESTPAAIQSMPVADQSNCVVPRIRAGWPHIGAPFQGTFR